MTWWKHLIIYISVAGICAAAGWFLHDGCYGEKIIVKWKTKVITKWIKPTTINYEYCYLSKMFIEAEIKKNELTIKAGDACKESKRTMTIDIYPQVKPHVLNLFPVAEIFYNDKQGKLDTALGGGIMYHYRFKVLNGLIGTGVGLAVTQRSVLIMPSMQLNF